MAEKLKVGDRVRIGKGQRIFAVAEVDPCGCNPLAPATYTVRIAPEDGKGVDLLYGNTGVEKI